jgi:tRNA pseudouridine38-40 synthase
MKRTALKIGYIGPHFHGFQRQPNVRTVEEEIINTLRDLNYIDDLKEARFRIAGRTDSGVHSLGNVISFQSEKDVLINQINNSLPEDVQILAKAPVRFGFKPRYAKMRQYRYILFEKNLDMESLYKCADIFKGTHNFINFSKRKQKTPIRTIEDIQITKPIIKLNNNIKNNDYVNLTDSYSPIFIDIYGESFLWNMVRKMMRIFVLVGNHKLSLDDVELLLNPKKNEDKACIKVMDADQLILMNIEYEGIKFQNDEYAIERFKRILSNNILNFQRNYSLTECILNSLDDIQ